MTLARAKLDRARDALGHAARAYDDALTAAVHQREAAAISTAFDEADRLQARVIRCARQVRELEAVIVAAAPQEIAAPSFTEGFVRLSRHAELIAHAR